MADLSPLAIAMGIGLLVASIAAWAAVLLRWKRGAWATEESRQPVANPHWASVLMTVLYTSLSLAALTQPKKALTEDFGISHVQSVCFTTAMLGLIIALPLLLDQQTHPSRLGFHVRRFSRQLLAGCWGYAAAFGPVAIVYGLTTSLRSADTQHQLLKLISAQPTFSTLLWVTIAAAVCAPMVEELLYRVVLQSALRKYLPRSAAIFLTALIFSAVHRWPDAIPLMPLALVLGVVYEQTRSYWSVVWLHVLFNATNILMLWLSLAPNPASL